MNVQKDTLHASPAEAGATTVCTATNSRQEMTGAVTLPGGTYAGLHGAKVMITGRRQNVLDAACTALRNDGVNVEGGYAVVEPFLQPNCVTSSIQRTDSQD